MERRDPSHVGELVRYHRIAAALSQEALAERAGLSVRAVSDLERIVHRVPRLETVRLLADALHLDEYQRRELLAAARPEFAAAPVPGAERAAPRAALPLAPTRLIGREAEVIALGRVLRQSEQRLVTLIGPGGVGKTRLALAAADALADRFADGVVFVDLAPVRDPGLIAAVVATALSIREVGAQSVGDQLAAYLGTRAMLLVLDNFEQVLDAAPLVARLLASAPDLRILVTSREPLRLSGEQVIPVGPLALPDSGQAMRVDDPQRPEAVTLFIERAHAADPSFTFSAENAEAIVAVVRRLDGLPLAIELAASRVRTLPPAALLTRLERQPLRLLTGGPRDQPDRQRTIRDAIRWSYDLLTPSEQRQFRTLSVFVGGFTLEAAAAVATASEDGEIDVLDGVASLIDKSLVRRMDGPDGDPRFSMLETIREYGLEQLAANGEATTAHDAQVAWIVALAETAKVPLQGPDQVWWLKCLETELPNLRAALSWLEQTGDATTRLRLGDAIWHFWYIRGHMREGRGWLERALADGENASSFLRARAMLAVGALALGQPDFHAAITFADASMEVADRIGDRWTIAATRFLRGMVPQMQGDYPLAVARLAEALALWRQIDDPVWLGMVLTQLGDAFLGLPDLDQAVALHEEALGVLQNTGGPWTVALTLGCLGNVVLEQGDIARAEDLLRESLMCQRDIDDQWFVGDTLASLAIAAERRGQLRRAARLIGAVDALCDRNQAPLSQIPVQIARYEHMIVATRTQLGEEAFAVARAAGRAMTLAEAIGAAMIATPFAADDPISADSSAERAPEK